MDRQRTGRALIGLMAGAAAGLGVGFILLRIFNFLCTWTGRGEPIEITWWSVIPFALVLGLSMAINMLHPPLGD